MDDARSSTSLSGLDVVILEELAQAGLDVPDLVSLRRTGDRYPPAATELLVRWLEPTTDDPSLQERIVRALSVPWARAQALPALLDLFATAPGGTPPADARRWAIGNALDVLATDAVFDRMLELARDRDLGPSRQMVVLWLGRTKAHREEAVPALVELLRDPDVSGHAVDALARLKDPRSLEALRSMVDDPRAWVRTKARRTVAALDG